MVQKNSQLTGYNGNNAPLSGQDYGQQGNYSRKIMVNKVA